jgi:predicted Zn-dependent protease with MMP-like domain
MRRSEAAFQLAVSRALTGIPSAFQPYLQDLVVQVEDWPAPELLAEVGLGPDEDLYGLYLGTPLTERGHDPGLLPDRILLFRGPLEEDFDDPQELEDEIRLTVIHEVAHHFGIDEDRLEALGLD